MEGKPEILNYRSHIRTVPINILRKILYLLSLYHAAFLGLYRSHLRWLILQISKEIKRKAQIMFSGMLEASRMGSAILEGVVANP